GRTWARPGGNRCAERGGPADAGRYLGPTPRLPWLHSTLRSAFDWPSLQLHRDVRARRRSRTPEAWRQGRPDRPDTRRPRGPALGAAPPDTPARRPAGAAPAGGSRGDGARPDPG